MNGKIIFGFLTLTNCAYGMGRFCSDFRQPFFQKRAEEFCRKFDLNTHTIKKESTTHFFKQLDSIIETSGVALLAQSRLEEILSLVKPVCAGSRPFALLCMFAKWNGQNHEIILHDLLKCCVSRVAEYDAKDLLCVSEKIFEQRVQEQLVDQKTKNLLKVSDTFEFALEISRALWGLGIERFKN